MGGTRASVEKGLQHPQGVQPWGNYLFTQGRDTRNEGAFRLNASMADHDWLPSRGSSMDFDVATLTAERFSYMLTKCGCLAGLGRLRVLDDELFMQVLSLLPAETLGRLACVNKALYCFASHEDLWRALTLQASCPYFYTSGHVHALGSLTGCPQLHLSQLPLGMLLLG